MIYFLKKVIYYLFVYPHEKLAELQIQHEQKIYKQMVEMKNEYNNVLGTNISLDEYCELMKDVL